MILRWWIRTGSDRWFSKIYESGLDRIQFHAIRTGLGLKNSIDSSSLVPMSHFLHCLLTFFVQAAHFLCLPSSVLFRTWPVGDSLVAIVTLEDKNLDDQQNLGQNPTEASGSFWWHSTWSSTVSLVFLRPLNARSKHLPMQHPSIWWKNWSTIF